MSEHVFYGYSGESLIFDPASSTYTLDPAFSSVDRVRFDVAEEHGEADETKHLSVVVTDARGNQIATGQVGGQKRAFLRALDGATPSVDRIEMDGVFVGYVPSEPLQPGVPYTRTSDEEINGFLWGPDTRSTYQECERNGAPCFGPGAMITTQNGEIPVEWLETGDQVLTRDHGFQPIVWIGRTKLTQEYFKKFPEDTPVRIPAGALGQNSPSHDLHVTGEHRIMIRSAKAEMMFFSSEVFAPARAWAQAGIAVPTPPKRSYTLTHILCASHEIIMAQGAWVESMFIGAETMRRLGADDRAAVERVQQSRGALAQTARPCLSEKEAALLFSAERMGRRRPLNPSYAKSA